MTLKFCSLSFLIFNSIFISAQISEKDYEIIETKCSKNSYLVAESSYKKSALLKAKNNFTDFEELYRTLLDSKCNLYKPILIRYWSEHKTMSDDVFENYFLNKPENYKDFIKGFYTDNYYTEQEMNEYSFISLLKYLYSVSPKDMEDYMTVVFSNDEKISSTFLYFFDFLQQEKLTEKYKGNLFQYVLYKKLNFTALITFLFTYLKDTKPVAEVLEKTQDHWNRLDNSRRTGYYYFLKRDRLLFKNNNPDFELDKDYTTKINFEKVINDLKAQGLIGNNPVIYAFSKIQSYEKGQLIPTLQKMEAEYKIDLFQALTPKEVKEFNRLNDINNPDGVLYISLLPNL